MLRLTAEAQKPEHIDDIPDISDSPPLPVKELANVNLKSTEEELDEIPDIDDLESIPDIDEGAGLEDEDNAAVRIVHPSA